MIFSFIIEKLVQVIIDVLDKFLSSLLPHSWQKLYLSIFITLACNLF